MSFRAALVRTISAGTLAIVGVIVAHQLMYPAPIPAPFAVTGGLIGLWVHGRWESLVAGVASGLLAGVAVHTMSHIVEGRVDSASLVFQHVMLDAAKGLVVAFAVLTLVVVVDLVVAKRRPDARTP